MTTVAVASPLRLATEAGLDAARRGGNAIDAALATAAVLTVAYPANCAIGGDLLALVREPDGRITFIDASGSAPYATDAGRRPRRHREMPIRGPHPGHRPRHGRRLVEPLRPRRCVAVARPARPGAGGGRRRRPGVAGLAESIAEPLPSSDDFPDLAALLCPEGTPLAVGRTLRQPALARTFATLAEAGAVRALRRRALRQRCAPGWRRAASR